mmetsp:Transcript_27751/g.36373  ORF Transcript_27751/g.36373 Transcript_27751/m.36373 type:complete len:633 (+) Transcript_27751:32-1930(+)
MESEHPSKKLKTGSDSTECQKLLALRQLLQQRGYNGIIVGSEDSHMSEYVPSKDERRAWISEFTGSAGTALITSKCALLWTDGRYWLQASQQLGKGWKLMKMAESDVPTLEEWLGTVATKDPELTGLPSGAKVVVDPMLVSEAKAKELGDACAKGSLELVFSTSNLIDELWNDQPAAPTSPIKVHPVSLAGKSSEEKLVDLREAFVKAGAGAIVVTALDEIAWLFNIRGSDISYNPVTIAYALVTEDQATLFTDTAKVSPEVVEHLGDSVTTSSYEEILDAVQSLSSKGVKVAYDPHSCNAAIANSIAKELRVELDSPIAEPKAIKNPTELEGLRQSHIRDGAALTCFLAWLEDCMKKGDAGDSGWPLTEVSASDKLEEFRQKVSGYVSLSFPTIAGYGSNGAIIHYQAEKETCANLGTDSLFLLDSGAQYKDGTTDVTRTVYLGQDEPNPKFKEAYTRVLKGHIALDRVVFPEGILGSKLDVLARLALWESGLDYKHGTGHGVGAFLNVHEGPQGIHYRLRPNEKGMKIGMTTSNEPGYYEEGQFGVRIENISFCVQAETPHQFGGNRYCTFETITMCPLQTKLIEKSLLSQPEIDWVNEYHRTVRRNLLPLIKDADVLGQAYLIKETEAI